MNQAALQLEKIREKLLDLGLRGNSLLHFAPRGKKHIDIIDEKSSEIFKLLVQQEKKMSFLPSPEIFNDEDDSTESIRLPQLEEYLSEEKGEARHTDLHLQTKLMPDDLDTRLLRIENEAKTIYQERGIDVLYLALGFLRWFEDKNSSKERFAPLLLIPIELKRTAAGKGFKLNYTGLDLTENETLYAKVKNDLGIELPRRVSDDQSELDLNTYFDDINQSVKTVDRFEVITDKMALGFFSFGKFQMYKDLDDKEWPEDNKPSKKGILEKLFEQGFELDKNEFSTAPVDFSVSELRFPERLNLIKDADSTQTEAVLKVINGQDLVIQGPPGTGKSQTITNLIAEAISRDQKVLFVAQKLTALEVVKNRLDQSHIGQSVLELHSHKSRPRDVIDSLQETLFEDSPESPERNLEKEKLIRVKDYLDQYAQLMGESMGKSNFTFGIALGKYIRLKDSSEKVSGFNGSDFDFYRKFDSELWSNFQSDLALILDKISEYESLSDCPYFNARIIKVDPDLVNQIQSKCGLLLDAVESREHLLNQVMGFDGFQKPVTIQDVAILTEVLSTLGASSVASSINFESNILRNPKRLSEFAAKASGLFTIRATVQEVFEPEALLMSEVSSLITAKKNIESHASKWYSFIIGDFTKAKKQCKALFKHTEKFNASLAIEQIQYLIDYLRLKYEVKEEDSIWADLIGDNWNGYKSDWNGVNKALEFCKDVSNKVSLKQVPDDVWPLIKGARGQEAKYNELYEQLSNVNKKIDEIQRSINEELKFREEHNKNEYRLEDQKSLILQRLEGSQSLYFMSQLNSLLNRLSTYGADTLIDIIYQYKGAVDELARFIEYSFWKIQMNDFYTEHEVVNGFDRTVHEKFIKEFVELDSYTFVFAQEYLVQYLHDKLPSTNAPGEMSMLRREMQKKRKLLPVRRLLEKTGTVIQAIKPVFMMSPMSVATFLPPGKLDFDLVIFDEASQVPIPDSIGAMLRGKQVVVVGDSKQMPPTNFFSRSVETADEDLEDDFTAEIESILDLFIAQGVNQSMLKWHYRSKHESLIYTSNKEFYDGKLFVFPSSGAITDAIGLKYEFSEGSTYDRGGSRTNLIEAQLVAQKVKEHIEQHPELSLGVVAFSMVQKDAIMFQIEFMRRNHPELEFYFNNEDQEEAFFVKNLENVQGDERDVIFISVGYGKTPNGNMSKSFGPINTSGGERRLNVLMSRAKKQMRVFSNFKWDEMKTNHDSPFGVRVLKSFLRYAETGVADIPTETGNEADSLFEVEVAKRIKELGYNVQLQVGSQGFFIDIAIQHPEKEGVYLLAVECDGASYHSSANARDRDRLRQSILESVGWRFHRIWSTDWFRDERAEVLRLKERIESLLSQPEKAQSSTVNIKPEIARVKKGDEEQKAHHEYVKANLSNLPEFRDWRFYDSFDDISIDQLEVAFKAVIEVEAPVHIEVVFNRVLEATNFNRMGAKIKKRMEKAVSQTKKSEGVILDKDFFYFDDKEIIVRDRSELHQSEKNIEIIPINEVVKCIHEVVAESLSIEEDELAKEVFSRFGIKAVRAKARESFDTILNEALSHHEINRQETKICLS